VNIDNDTIIMRVSRLPYRRPGGAVLLPGAAIGAVLLLLAGSPGAIAAPPQSDGDAAAGKTIFDKYCASCHGKSGKGIGTLPNLSDARYMAGRTDDQLLDKIAKGGQGSGMPSWEKLLSDQLRRDVLAYIRTLAK
jgi:mono/diheme cytochrome c family protein